MKPLTLFRKHRSAFLLTALAVTCIGLGAIAANPGRAVDVVEEPRANSDVRFEIQWYADTYGVSLDEAQRRSDLLLETHRVKRELRDLAPERLSAVWSEHAPEFKVVAWYVGPVDTLPPADSIVANAPLPVEIRGDAPLTEEQFVATAEAIRDALPDDIDAVGLSVEGMTGIITLELQPTSPYRDAVGELAVDLSSRFGIVVEVTVAASPGGDDTTFGGKRLTYNSLFPSVDCTTGFTVANDAGATGALTAAHCSNTHTYWEQPTISFGTTFVAASHGPYTDVQWSSVAGTEEPVFYDGNTHTSLLFTTERIYQLGDSVCRYGTISGTQCSYVASITYVPLWAGACNGSPCGGSWIRVYGIPTSNGDSGGPYFWTSIGYGIVKGHAGGHGVYMAIDYATYYLGVYPLLDW